MEVLEHFVDKLWNPYLLILFTAVGLYCSLLTGFLQVSIPFWWRETLGQKENPKSCSPDKTSQNHAVFSQFSALCMALATTIGTGSIAGVATALWWGGPGAIFWMWVSAFLGMMLSACERILTLQYRISDGKGGFLGGPMYYLEKGMNNSFLAKWFALACSFSAIMGGNLVQSSSISQGMNHLTGMPTPIIGLILALLVSFALRGGMASVTKISTIFVPIMAGLYLLSGIFCIMQDIPNTIAALKDIVNSAFHTRSIVAGGSGYTLMISLRYGMARGIFSNEAGLGAGSMAHSNANVDTPFRQGLWGMVEVFFATIVVCTITALVILTSGIYQGDVAQFLNAQNTSPILPVGVPLTQMAFSVELGELGAVIVLISLILFAFTSILGWSCYGKQCITYLNFHQGCYQGILTTSLMIGSIITPNYSKYIWVLVDLSLVLMALPNLIGLTYLAPNTCRQFVHWVHTKKK